MTHASAEYDFNFAWAESFVNELFCLGVRTFVLSPGARSSALALALAHRNDIDLTIHFDERGAAFYALGAAKFSGIPSTVICTSGTAGGNYLPAVMEAYNSSTPLIIVTADRPEELHARGANQTIEQTSLYSSFVANTFLLTPPDDKSALSDVRTATCQAFHTAVAESAPVHMNMPFREPLVTTLTRQSLPENPLLQREKALKALAANDQELLLQAIHTAKQGVLVVGTVTPHQDCDALLQFAAALQWPCFIDISSQLRFLGSEAQVPLLTHFDTYLRNNEWNRNHAPDCVIRIGTTCTSKYLEKYLASCSGDYIHISEYKKINDPEAAVTKKIQCSFSALSDSADKINNTPSLLTDVLCNAESSAATRIKQCADKLPAKAQWRSTLLAITEAPAARAIFIGNSLAIREADATCPCVPVRHVIGSNRGVSGIDGLIASGVGFANQARLPATIVLGDLSALHDLNSLALIAKAVVPVIVVINNNDGGAIFSLLPALQDRPQLRDFFQTPHGLTFEHAAKQFKLSYQAIHSLEEFADNYIRACSSNISVILEVFCEASEAAPAMKQLSC